MMAPTPPTQSARAIADAVRRGETAAADTVAARFRAEIDHRHADARGGGVEDLVAVRQTCGKCIHKAIAVIGRVKPHLTARAGHAERVAIPADPGHDSVHQQARFRKIGGAKALQKNLLCCTVSLSCRISTHVRAATR